MTEFSEKTVKKVLKSLYKLRKARLEEQEWEVFPVKTLSYDEAIKLMTKIYKKTTDIGVFTDAG